MACRLLDWGSSAVVLLNIGMPEVDGPMVTPDLHSEPERKITSGVMLTSSWRNEIAEKVA